MYIYVCRCINEIGFDLRFETLMPNVAFDASESSADASRPLVEKLASLKTHS